MLVIRNNRINLVVMLFIVFVLIWPSVAMGQIDTYVPISALPGVVPDTGLTGLDDASGLENYLNSVFNFTVGIAVLLAVIMIAYGGIKYMTSDVVTSKQDAKEQIGSAIKGLLLLLATVVILSQINPDLAQFRFGPSELGTSAPNAISGSTTAQECIQNGGQWICQQGTPCFCQ